MSQWRTIQQSYSNQGAAILRFVCTVEGGELGRTQLCRMFLLFSGNWKNWLSSRSLYTVAIGSARVLGAMRL